MKNNIILPSADNDGRHGHLMIQYTELNRVVRWQSTF